MNTFVPGVNRIEKKVTFGTFAEGAEAVKLKLYRPGEIEPEAEYPLEGNGVGDSFFTVLPQNLVKGREYLFEADGREYTDPYARRVAGRDCFGKERSRCERGVVDFGSISMSNDRPPQLAMKDLIVYEAHLRGLTMHESSRVKAKGTFKGLLQKLPYIRSLGVNAVLLLPIYDFDELAGRERILGGPAALEPALAADKRRACEPAPAAAFEHLHGNGTRHTRVNYWGYGTLSYYYAPKAAFAFEPDKAVDELKRTVLAFHREDIELYMDIDFSEDTGLYDRIGILRFWHEEYHIDGFRLNPSQLPFEALRADRLLKDAKLFSNEEWGCLDLRRFLKSDEGMLGRMMELWTREEKTPAALRMITSHNGFTLYDLYSYDVRHNLDNGENGKDGTDYNCSWNCGAEGETSSRKIQSLRLRLIRNAFAALVLGKGIPCLLAGDECLNSQKGNNNAYCQDNETGWVVWNDGKQSRDMTDFVKNLIKIRRNHGVFRQSSLSGKDYGATGCPDLSFHGVKPWSPDMSVYSRTLGVMLSGSYVLLDRQKNLFDDSFYLAYNCHWEDHVFDLPFVKGKSYSLVLSTAQTGAPDKDGRVLIPARSIALFSLK